MERVGLVGLPNSGKTSLFNALTKGSALVAPHMFSTTETTVGVAQVADSRLEALGRMSASRKVVHAGVEIVDIAGLVEGSSAGEGLGNRFLAGIREMDALCYVLRGFEDSLVPGYEEPATALSVLELELVMADIHSMEAQMTRKRKQVRGGQAAAADLEAMQQAMDLLQQGVPLYRAAMSEHHREALREHFLLTDKPVLVVVNVGEDAGDQGTDLAARIQSEIGGAAEVLATSVKLEAEAAGLEAGDAAELLEGLGLGEGALARVARAAYQLLGRRTFLTTGEKESRAWTFKSGAKAPECAGVIHSDLERGFIRAEVVHWDELLQAGSWSAAKASGKLRLEGKDYEVQDGDVLEIRFNVTGRSPRR